MLVVRIATRPPWSTVTVAPVFVVVVAFMVMMFTTETANGQELCLTIVTACLTMHPMAATAPAKNLKTTTVALRITSDEKDRLEEHRKRIAKRNPHLLVSDSDALREVVAEGLCAVERRK